VVENSKVKVDPFPRSDLSLISPLSPFAIYWQMLRPSPWLVAFKALLALSFVLKNGAKIDF